MQVVLHVGEAANDCVPPEVRLAVPGVIATEVNSHPPVAVTVTIATGLCFVIPLSVALTKRPTVPAVLPAVKVSELPDVALTEPLALFVRDHENVVPDGQVAVHVGVAAKDCMPPMDKVADAGLTATEERIAFPPPPPMNFHVSAQPLKQPSPPKRTTYPSAASYATVLQIRAIGEVVGRSWVHCPPTNFHVSPR